MNPLIETMQVLSSASKLNVPYHVEDEGNFFFLFFDFPWNGGIHRHCVMVDKAGQAEPSWGTVKHMLLSLALGNPYSIEEPF